LQFLQFCNSSYSFVTLLDLKILSAIILNVSGGEKTCSGDLTDSIQKSKYEILKGEEK